MTAEVALIVEAETVGCSLWHSPLVSGAGAIGARAIEGEICRQNRGDSRPPRLFAVCAEGYRHRRLIYGCVGGLRWAQSRL